MSLTLTLSSAEERKLQDAAATRGVRPEELAHRLLAKELSPSVALQPVCAQKEEMSEERRDWDPVTPHR